MNRALNGFLIPSITLMLSVFTSCSYLETEFAGQKSEDLVQNKELSLPYPLIGPLSQNGYQAILATTDLGLGENRFAFVLISKEGFVNSGTASLGLYRAETQISEQRYEAPLLNWIFPRRGSYVSYVEFAQKGEWKAVIDFLHEGNEQRVELSFLVRENTIAPNIGDPAPKAPSKTLSDVKNIQDLSTGIIREPALYRHSLAETVNSGRPSVVAFTSPAFCKNEVCGPQVEVLLRMHEELNQQAYFIHVEVYDNPDELQGDLDLARFSGTFQEWGLPSLQWTFVIDCEGKIANRFEGFATSVELRSALMKLMQNIGTGQHCRTV